MDGINIYDYRMQKGWTQKYIAYKVDVSQQAVALWEKGTPPMNKHRKKIAALFGVGINDIDWGDEHGNHRAKS